MTSDDSAAQAAPPPKRQKKTLPLMCCICHDSLEPKDVVYRCGQCRYGHFCVDCLRNWFLQASVSETRMPVKCCELIPVSTMADILTGEEVKKYEAKFDEWATFDKLYCPVPRCSAFIPTSLYVLPPGYNKSLPMPPSANKRPIVACPACHTDVCTTCRSAAHPFDGDECTRSPEGLDPLLEAKFKRWGVKRCPRCKAPVRLMYGCSSVQCRCSHHFCFRCLQAIDDCDGRCQEEEYDDENEHEHEDDDGDGDDGDIDEYHEVDDDSPAKINLREREARQPANDPVAERRPSDVPSNIRQNPAPRAETEQSVPPREDVGHDVLESLFTERVGPDPQAPDSPPPPRPGTGDNGAHISQESGNHGEEAREEDEDLDAAVGSELDLGSDPDEPPTWKCRHQLWVRMSVKPSLIHLPCEWCKDPLVPGDLRRKVAGLAEYHEQVETLNGTTYWACAHCTIQACQKCGEALELKSQTN